MGRIFPGIDPVDLRDFVMFESITVKYSDDDMRCDIFYNGKKTAIYAARDGYDDEFSVFIEGRSKPVFKAVPGWGVVGGISMILNALIEAEESE